MRSRTTYPGARLWPAPEVSRVRRGTYSPASEVWAVGIVVMELVEGRASVQRMYQSFVSRSRSSGNGAGVLSPPGVFMPSLREPSRWSAALRDFIQSACAHDPSQRASAAELLNGEFVALADGCAFTQAVDHASTLPTPDTLQGLYDREDVVATLHRRNNCVRAPLINLDALNAEDFVGTESRVQNEISDNPAVEVALRTALRNRLLDDTIGLGRGPEDLGGVSSNSTLQRLACFIDTIDMSARRTR